MTHKATSFARKARYLVVKIEGPVPWLSIHELKGLHIALGHKIAELERMGHWDRPGITTAEPATSDTTQTKTDQPIHGSAPSSYTLNVATARKRRGEKTPRLDAAKT